MKADEKKCPRCAEIIKKEALVCKHCGHEFPPEEVKAAKPDNKNAGIGCAVLIGIVLLAAMCSSGGDDSNSAGGEAATAAATAEEKQKGFHCLSKWDGSHPEVVDALKESLRDPDSFEHDSTQITPVDAEGNHTLIMTYRAKNGFGGVNKSDLYATVKNSDCSYTVTSTGE